MKIPSRTYDNVVADVPLLITQLRKLLDAENFSVQQMQADSTTVLQARKSTQLRDLSGFSYAMTIRISIEEGGTRVEIGRGKWIDKAAVGAAGVILTGGLLGLVPAIGAFWQKKFIDDAWAIVENHMAARPRPVMPSFLKCGRCGATAVVDSKFCSSCGKELLFELQCENCGRARQDPYARFCNGCGQPFKSETSEVRASPSA